MKKRVAGTIIFVTAMFFVSTTAMAADQVKKQDRIRDRKKDGSCQVMVIDKGSLLLGADQLRDRDPIKDQKKDGSCKAVTNDSNLLAADQLRDRDQTKDQKKDGSCQS
jgi:hypothetical protein